MAMTNVADSAAAQPKTLLHVLVHVLVHVLFDVDDSLIMDMSSDIPTPRPGCVCQHGPTLSTNANM